MHKHFGIASLHHSCLLLYLIKFWKITFFKWGLNNFVLVKVIKNCLLLCRIGEILRTRFFIVFFKCEALLQKPVKLWIILNDVNIWKVINFNLQILDLLWWLFKCVGNYIRNVCHVGDFQVVYHILRSGMVGVPKEQEIIENLVWVQLQIILTGVINFVCRIL